MTLPAISQEKFQLAMNPLFTERKFTEYDFDRMSDLLLRLGKIEWSYRPRMYTVLRMMGQVQLMDCFVNEGLKDIAFPFTAERLPNDLKDPLIQHEFLENQKLVLTKAADLEVSGGRHRHFGQDGDVHFDNLGLLGTGGFGSVHHVRSKLSRREYARKKIYRKRAFSSDKEAIKLLENELSHLKKLSHEHIVKLIGSYTDPKYVCLLIVPIADFNLEQFLNRQPFPNEDLDLLRGFYGCLSSAILYLHENKCRHKDIKPSNILIKDKTVYVADFGTARDSSNHTRSTTTGIPEFYTRLYAAPEVVDQGSRNSSTDIWSLGCVFLDMTTILNGETLNYKTTFFESCGTHQASPAENPDGLHDWFYTPRSKDSDVRPFKWIQRMLNKKPRISSESLESGANLDVRPTAADVLHQIQTFVGPYSYCGQCCRLEEDNSSHSAYQGSISEEEQEIPPRLDQGNRDKGADAQSTLLNHGRDSMMAAKPVSPKTAKSTIISTTVDDRQSPFLLATQNGSNGDLHPSSRNPYYEEAKEGQSEDSKRKKRKEIKNLLKEGGFINNSKNFRPDEAFLWAAKEDHYTVVSYMLNNGADIKAIDECKWTALHFAVNNGLDAISRLLIEKGVMIDSRNDRGYTPLHLATSGGRDAMVQLLIDYGASVNAKDDEGYTALHLAASGGHEAIARLLLEEEAIIDAESSENMTALHLAASSGQEGVARLLLEEGAPVNAKSSSHETALHEAAKKGHQEVVELLLENGAFIDAEYYEGGTALHMAAKNGHQKVVGLLLEKGASIDAVDCEERTALHRAAKKGHQEVVVLLLKKGALIDLEDCERNTALRLAAEEGHEEVAYLLSEMG